MGEVTKYQRDKLANLKADSLSVPHCLCGLCVLQRLHDRVVGDLGVVVIVEEEGLLSVDLLPVGVPEDGFFWLKGSQ